MKRQALILFFMMTTFSIHAYAGAPLWTFTPLTATAFTLPTDGSATVQYLVTNQSHKTHSLAIKQIPGALQMTTGSGICGNPFVLGYQQSCVLSLQIDGGLLQQSIVGGPVVCQTGPGNAPNPNACYQPYISDQLNITSSHTPGTTTISTTSSNLVLSVYCPAPSSGCTSSNAALTGIARTITVANGGKVTAINVTYTASSLPAGTTITPNSCDIASGDSCVFTITPGETPSAIPGELNPVPISLSFSGTNTNTVTVTANILTYGSVYQSGYVFSVNDSTPITISAAGTVVTTTDMATFIAWQPGCVDSATCISTNANDYLNGDANTADIVDALSSSYPSDEYAGGVCGALSIDGYSNWYLPALCEMSYHDLGTNPCGSVSNPTIQNIQSNLVDNGFGNFDTNFAYWSSTQDSGDPLLLAFFNAFDLPGRQGGEIKTELLNVRCARAF